VKDVNRGLVVATGAIAVGAMVASAPLSVVIAANVIGGWYGGRIYDSFTGNGSSSRPR
jgi:hypothetical protein